MPLIGVMAFTWDGIYVGATAARSLRNSTIAAVVAFFATWAVCITIHGSYDKLAMHLLLLAYFAHLAARSLWMHLHWRKAILEKPFEN